VAKADNFLCGLPMAKLQQRLPELFGTHPITVIF
jgi:hypothetical protein